MIHATLSLSGRVTMIVGMIINSIISLTLASFCMIAAVVFYTYFVAIILRNVNLLALK
jgi:hypothetical protein